MAYKQRFYEVRKEMEKLRDELTEQHRKMVADKHFMALDEERTWYREELQKANERCKRMEASYKKLQAEHDEALADRNLLLAQLIDVKKENKALYQERVRRNPPAASIATGPIPSTLSKSLKTVESNFERTLRLTTPPYNRTQESEKKTPQTAEPNYRTMDFAHESLNKRNRTQMGRLETGKSTRPGCEETVAALRRQLDAERRRSRDLATEQVKAKTRDTELCDFLVSCIDEVKKDIVFRQRASLASLRGQKPMTAPEDSARPTSLSSFLGSDRK